MLQGHQLKTCSKNEFPQKVNLNEEMFLEYLLASINYLMFFCYFKMSFYQDYFIYFYRFIQNHQNNSTQIYKFGIQDN
jgi:hypothetical protein